MNVNYNYLKQEFSKPDNIINEWKKLIKSTDYTLGKYVNRFEKVFSNFIGSKYCVSTNNGTDALILCLKSIGIKDNYLKERVINVFNKCDLVYDLKQNISISDFNCIYQLFYFLI